MINGKLSIGFVCGSLVCDPMNWSCELIFWNFYYSIFPYTTSSFGTFWYDNEIIIDSMNYELLSFFVYFEAFKLSFLIALWGFRGFLRPCPVCRLSVNLLSMLNRRLILREKETIFWIFSHGVKNFAKSSWVGRRDWGILGIFIGKKSERRPIEISSSWLIIVLLVLDVW